MNRLSKYTSATLLSLFCYSHFGTAAPAVTPEQEQAAIQQVREQLPKNREEILKKQIPADWSKLPDDGLNVLPAALAALRLNVDVEQANEALQKHEAAHPIPAGKFPDFYAFMPAYAMIYHLFSASSTHFPGRLTAKTEAAMKAQMWRYVEAASKVDNVSLTEPLQILSTENHDLRARTSFYLFSAVLKDDPEYRDRKYKDGHTAAEHYAALNEFYKKNLKAKALNGLWFEVCSTNYAKFNWLAVLVMAEVAPDETVRKYAKMLLDLAWVENTEMSFGYDRFGGKFRTATSLDWAKPQMDISSRITGGVPYVNLFAPLLFGEKPSVNLFTIPWAASDYQVPDIAILLHRFGSDEPPCEIINKVLSVIAPRSDDEGQSKGNSQDKGASPGITERIQGGPLLNYTYKTPKNALGGIMFDPAESLSPISTDRRWAGLIFNDTENTRVAPFPEASGGDPGRHIDAFWHVQYKNVMVGQKYKSFRVRRMRAFIPPGPEREEVDGWVFVNLGDAFAAVLPAYGGYTWDTTAEWTDAASGKSVVMNFNDEWAPIILHAGDAAEFGSYAQFKEKILKDSKLKVTDNAVIYQGVGLPAITFYHKQVNEIRTTKNDKAAVAGGMGYAGKLKLPEIGGKPVNLTPALSYQSPFMSSVPGTEKVRTAFGSLVKEYDFGK